MSVTDAMENGNDLSKSSNFSNRLFYHILNLIMPDYISKEKNTKMFVNPEKIIAEDSNASDTDAWNCPLGSDVTDTLSIEASIYSSWKP